MTVSNPPPSRGGLEAGEPPQQQHPPQQPQEPPTSAVEDTPPTAEEAQVEAADPDPDALIAAFPLAKLQKLEELISNPRWVIPVLPNGELEVLLEAAIALAKVGADKRCEACMRFYREGLTVSFKKIMEDEAVSSWRLDIHKCILRNCERLIELCVLKLDDDWFPILDLLAMVMNPSNKFHNYNSSRPAEFPIEDAFARSNDARMLKGWLVDLINRFGHHGGFAGLLKRFTVDKTVGESSDADENNGLNVNLIYSLVRPFGQCYELLTTSTVTTYLLPIVEAVPKFLENLSDDELKKEAKNESKNDSLSAIVKSLKSLASTIPSQEENVRQLELFRLKMILRQLQISSFGGKMNALNEVNRVIASVSYYPNQQQQTSGQQPQQQQAQQPAAQKPEGDEDFLTADRMASWLKDNKVLQIVLQDNLHQPQYVEKLEKVIRFLVKEKVLSMEDLDDIWAAQVGQHEAIVKNVHDLLAKLAWDFTPPQMDHLFERFQSSWSTANVKQREKLLELIRHLAEDDKEGVMADKVLSLFWNLAHANDVAIDIMDQALSAHIKILDYSCTQYRYLIHWSLCTVCFNLILIYSLGKPKKPDG
jgi:ubiquitin carboxyl-terminal hydrolase 9/24